MFDAGSIIGHLKLDVGGWNNKLKQTLNNTTADVKRSMATMASNMRQLGMSLSFVGAGITATTTMITKVGAGAEDAINKLSVTARNAGIDLSKSQSELKDFFNDIRENTSQAVTDTTALLGKFIPYTNDLSKAMEAVKLSSELAAAGVMDFETSVRAVGAAYQGNFMLLERSIKIFSDYERAQFKSMTSDEQRVFMFEKLRKAYGGIALEEAQSVTGRLRQMQNAFGDFWEEVGMASNKYLYPYIVKIKNSLIILQDWVAAHGEIAGKIVSSLAIAGTAMLAFGSSIWVASKAMTALKVIITAMNVLFSPLTIAIVGVGAATYALRAMWVNNFMNIKQTWKEFVDIVKVGWDKIKKWFGDETFATFVNEFSRGIQIISLYVQDLINEIERLKDVFKISPETFVLKVAAKILPIRFYKENLENAQKAESAVRAVLRKFGLETKSAFREPEARPKVATDEAIRDILNYDYRKNKQDAFTIGYGWAKEKLGEAKELASSVVDVMKVQFEKDLDSLGGIIENNFPEILDSFNKIREEWAKTIEKPEIDMTPKLMSPKIDPTWSLIADAGLKTTKELAKKLEKLQQIKVFAQMSDDLKNDAYFLEQVNDKIKSIENQLDVVGNKASALGITTSNSIQKQITELENLKQHLQNDPLAMQGVYEKIEELTMELKPKMKMWMDTVKNAFENTFNAMENTMNSFFDDVIDGNLKKGKDYFKSFCRDVLKGFGNMVSQMVRQWIAGQAQMSFSKGSSMWLMLGKMAGGFAQMPTGGGMTPQAFGSANGTSWAFYDEGGYVPRTSPAIVHAGETVLPAHLSPATQRGEAREVVIYNFLTPEAQARAMVADAPKNVIVNIVNENMLNNGSLRMRMRE